MTAGARTPDFRGDEVDVCIVGSGAGGGTLAFALARAGVRVVVLEKGPWYTGKDFVHDEIAVVRRDMWVPYVHEEPHLLARAGEATARPTTDGWIACCVGGGTVHMSGFFFRLHPEDFRLRARYGGAVAGATLADWPITYADLAPWYDAVEREIGLSGEARGNPFEPPRAAGYPLPPLDENPLAALVDAGARKVGAHAFKTPRAILSRPYGGRAPCAYCDFCGSYGCETGAKSSTLAALLPRAIETGRCEVRPRAMAFEVTCDAAARVRGVSYLDEAGRAQTQRARVVCVSASAIESARLLLNSRSARFPNGLANGAGLVGRHLTFSTLGRAWGAFDVASLPDMMRPHHPVHFLQRAVQDHYFLRARAGGYDKGGTLNFLLPHRNPIYTALRLAARHQPPLWGTSLNRELSRYYKEVREIEFEVFGEFLPGPGTSVTVDGAVKDRFGLPVARIDLAPHPEDVRNSELLVRAGVDLLGAAGARATGVETSGGTTFVLQHGTCRFGTDPATSVLDPSCRAHEVQNLYVVDGSFMPTSGGVPTTMTIMANALRVAEHLVTRLRAREVP
jgi:choline dehydrogenase-like flavoprotein